MVATVAAVLPAPAQAQAQMPISVNPTGVNINTQAETVVFLSYGGLDGYEPVEALWCADLVDAFPDLGRRCDPATVLGGPPAGVGGAVLSGSGGLTDLMTIPASVSRRAWEVAAAQAGEAIGTGGFGGGSEFYYVRQFRSLSGGSDVFVAVTCRLAGGGARVPFAILDARLAFEVDLPVLTIRAGDPTPPLGAEIRYNGTGLLVARWEVVLPGDPAPTAADLLPEASLPVEDRAGQRRYLEVGRLSQFLPPDRGSVWIQGPDPAALPTDLEGGYQVVLRVEATADREGDTDLAAVGSGAGVVYTGGVAPFAIPPLRYYVGSAELPAGLPNGRSLQALTPVMGAELVPGEAQALRWRGVSGAVHYRVEVERWNGEPVARALLGPGSGLYLLPPWVLEPGMRLRWRVVALTDRARVLEATRWAEFAVVGPRS